MLGILMQAKKQRLIGYFIKIFYLIYSYFELPPALAGGIGVNVVLALAKKQVVLAKALNYCQNFISPAKAGGN